MRQPLLYPAFALMAGIALAEGLPLPAVFWFWAAALALAAGWLGYMPLRVAVCAGALGFGGWSYHLTQWPLAPDDLRGLTDGHSQHAVVRGVLQETPSVQLIERRGALAEYMTVRLAVSAWHSDGEPWQAASGTILIGSRGVPTNQVFRGQQVEVSGMLQAPAAAPAPGQFDYRSYLRQQGIGFQLMCEAPRDWALGPEPLDRPPLSERFLAWARRELQAGLPQDEAAGLIQTMTLGWRTGLAGDVQAAFMQSGTLHVFAISGLHIALIAATLVQVLRFVRMPRAACGLIAIPLIWGYIAVTGWQASAIRSAAMTTLVVGTWALNRPGDLVNSLAGAAVAVLLWQPGQLFQAGFQLSFGVVLALAWFGSPIAEWLKKWLVLRPDPFLAPELVPRWYPWINAALGWLAVGLATGLAANLGSLPLTVQWFHMFSPVSLGANLVVVPLSEWVLLSNLITMTAGAAVPWLGELANASAWAGMKAMVWLSRSSAELPHGWWYLRSPHWLWWIPYIVLLAALADGVWRRSRARWWLAGGAGVWTLALLWVWLPGPKGFRLTVFAGSPALFWQGGPGREMLIDGASETMTRRVLAPYLHAQGLSRAENWMVTQVDTVHLGKGGEVLRELRPERIYIPGGRVRSPALGKLAELLFDRSQRLDIVTAGDRVQGWSVLYPPANDDSSRASDHSAVLRFEQRAGSVLYCSELSPAAQERLAAMQGKLLRADVLIVSASAGTRPLVPEFLEAVKPRCVLINGATREQYSRGLHRLRRQLRQQGTGVWLLEQTGTVEVAPEAGGLRLTAMDGRELCLKAE